MAAMAGVGISNLFKIKQIVEIEEEKRSLKKEKIGEEQAQQKLDSKGKAMMEQEVNKEVNKEGGTVTVEFEGKTREVKLLDNPLPLPKKRARKTMDFDYDVKEDDDFDI